MNTGSVPPRTVSSVLSQLGLSLLPRQIKAEKMPPAKKDLNFF